jgi:hypothetical protein
MFTPLLAKIAVTAVLGFFVGFYGDATANIGQPAAPSQNVGAFGGPVTHVGSIDWDLSSPKGPMAHVRCGRDAADGTTCYLAG